MRENPASRFRIRDCGICSGGVALTLRELAASFGGMDATLDYAETHFSQLLRVVAAGEEVVLRRGEVAVAKIVPIPSTVASRPRVGEVTSGPVRWSAESFAPLGDDGLKELGLL